MKLHLGRLRYPLGRWPYLTACLVLASGCSISRNSHLDDASVGVDVPPLPDGSIEGLGLASPAPPGTQRVTIANGEGRVDSRGAIVDAHDGRLIQFGDRYYLYGTAYGNTDRQTEGNRYSVYGSWDLMDWTLESRELLHDPPDGIYHRPHVVYNESTEKYVLWYGWSEDPPIGRLGVAVSDTPTGPFEIVDETVTVLGSSDNGVADPQVFVDTDGTAYLTYTTVDGGEVSVERLTPDYLESDLEGSGVLANGFAAPVMFKRDAVYYVLSDVGCDFCDEGSGVQVFTASDPLGPYSYRANLNRAQYHKLGGANNGDRSGFMWEQGGGWNDDTSEVYPDWIRIDFDGAKTITAIDVFTLQDEYLSPVEPTREMMFELHGIVDFDIEARVGNSWMRVPGGAVRDNNLIWTHRQFAPITTTAVRVQVFDSKMNYSRITELEAWQADENVAAADAGGWATASSEHGSTWTRIVIPAQQTHVAELPTPDGPAFVWMGDMWDSDMGGTAGGDLQYWSPPFMFDPRGHISPLVQQTNVWSINLVNPRFPPTGNFTNLFNQSYEGNRVNHSGYVGFEFEPSTDLAITALGRAVSGSMYDSHTIKIWDAEDRRVIASAIVSPESPTDWLGYKYAALDVPVILESDRTYRVASQETLGGDCWMELGSIANHAANVVITRGVHDQQDGSGYPSHDRGINDQGFGPPTFYSGALPSVPEQTVDQNGNAGAAGTPAPVGGRSQRLQTFTPTVSTLSRIDLYMTREETTNAPLTVQVVELDTDREPIGVPLFSVDVPAGGVHPEVPVIVYPNLHTLVAGTEYGIVLKSPAGAEGAYSIFRSNANPYEAGIEQLTTEGGLLWTAASAGSGDLKFTTYR